MQCHTLFFNEKNISECHAVTDKVACGYEVRHRLSFLLCCISCLLGNVRLYFFVRSISKSHY